MSDTAIPTLDDCQMIDISGLSKITGLSKPTLWRHHDTGLIPAGCKIGRAVRWRLRTGDPQTGVLDWVDAGCPSRVDATPSTQTGGSLDGV
jgi:predicted DNA-binding transcriptional regulator AlpA